MKSVHESQVNLKESKWRQRYRGEILCIFAQICDALIGIFLKKSEENDMRVLYFGQKIAYKFQHYNFDFVWVKKIVKIRIFYQPEGVIFWDAKVAMKAL